MYFVLLILSLVLQQPQPTEPHAWRNGCHPDILPRIQEAVGYDDFDYERACEVSYTCGGDGWLTCDLRKSHVLEQSCSADDETCKNMAMLTALALGIEYVPQYTKEVDTELATQIIYNLRAFRLEDYDKAIESYQVLHTDYSDWNLYFSLIITYQQAGLADKALELCDSLMNTSEFHPMLHYLRAKVLGDLGREIEASFEGKWLRQYAVNLDNLEFINAVQPLIDRYPLDMTRFETWVLYPVMYYGSSPVGERTIDNTGLAPVAIQVAEYPEIGGVYVMGLLSNAVWIDDGTPKSDAFFLEQSEKGYLYFSPMPEAEVTIQLMPVDSAANTKIFLVYTDQIFFESEVKYQFLLAPANLPDPRQDILGERCEGGVISQLRSGMTALAGFGYGIVLDLLDKPNGDRIGKVDDLFTVIESVCIDGVTWWYSQTQGGNLGWLQGNFENDYIFTPYYSNYNNDERWLLYCPNAMTPRLFVGATGKVVGDLGVNNLRSSAGVDAEIIGQMPENAEFQVIGGAVCADGMVWWQVEYNGVQGWTAEGEASTYWLEPILPEWTHP